MRPEKITRSSEEVILISLPAGDMAQVTPATLRAARAMLDWTNNDIAERCGLSRNTVQALLNGTELKGRLRTLRAICNVLTNAGIIFTGDRQTGAIGVLLRTDKPGGVR